MNDVLPRDLEEARRLLEVPPTTAHTSVPEDAPVELFIDTHERLMRVVCIDKREYRKISLEK